MDDDALAAVVRKLLHTREVRRLLGTILPEALTVYAGNSRFRKVVARMARRHLSKSFSRAEDISENRKIEALFADEAFVRDAARALPDMVTSLLNAADTAAAAIERLETNEKTALVGELVSRMGAGRTGGLITRGCRIINDIHTDDPEFFARTLAPGFRQWIGSVDVGELKEAVDNSTADVRAFAVMVNDALWEYPAKVVLLLSLLPSVVNMTTASLDISVKRLNDLPPDLLADVVMSITREIDASHTGHLINELAELARKIHTGSALLGEPGSPQLPRLFSGKIEEMAGHLDPVVLWKARLAMAETGAAMNHAMTDAVNRRPDVKRLSMQTGPKITNIRVKTANRALSYWDGVDDDETAESFAETLSAYDVQEFAEAVNGALRIFNRLGASKPKLISRFIDQFTAAIDDDELAEAASSLFGDADGGVSDAARASVPQMVQWVAGVLAPADDAYEDEAQQAREALQNLFAGEEV